MQFTIRELDRLSIEELAIVTRGCMDAVLETVPEFEGREELAQRAYGNFSSEQMSEMIRNSYSNPMHRLMVATVDDRVVGHAIYSLKIDEEDLLYGFCFDRFVEPAFRRAGIAQALLEDQLDWFLTHNVAYIIAHTHVTNLALQNLYKKFGFRMEGPFTVHYPYYLLRKDITAETA